MDIFQMLDRESVFHSVNEAKSRFIPEDRNYVFAEGLNEGFENNYCMSSRKVDQMSELLRRVLFV